MRKIITLAMASSVILTVVFCRPAAACPIKSTLGALVGTPIGAIAGLVRGSTSKGVEYTGTFSDKVGHGAVGKIVGYPTGLIVGGLTGGLSGIVTGVVNGVSKGIDDPFSTESMSLDGDFMDFDPYAVFNK
jgi:hypothetical protein